MCIYKILIGKFPVNYNAGAVVVLASMLVVCFRNRGYSEYEEEQNVYLIAREVRISMRKWFALLWMALIEQVFNTLTVAPVLADQSS